MWERMFDKFLLFDCPINTSEIDEEVAQKLLTLGEILS